MLKAIHSSKPLQLILGLLAGICFGFLLQRGGVTRYGIIMGQLLLRDWSVVKIILTAIVTGMLGVHVILALGLATPHRKAGSVGSTVIGGLIFGVGFGLLGYCPGTATGAVGQGSVDALVGGVLGMLIGVAIYAAMYPKLKGGILQKGSFGDRTIPEMLNISPNIAVPAAAAILIVVLVVLERTTG